jgi:hypothetical protein
MPLISTADNRGGLLSPPCKKAMAYDKTFSLARFSVKEYCTFRACPSFPADAKRRDEEIYHRE